MIDRPSLREKLNLPVETVDDVAKLVTQWAIDRGICDNSDLKSQALKTVSEVGEFCDNVLKGRETIDDVGDILVTLQIHCHLKGISLSQCFRAAYDEVSKRKGKMVNGTFIKEGDNIK